jgi:hypothetical protein
MTDKIDPAKRINSGKKYRKHKKCVDWWKNNWIGITTLIVAILTFIATVIFGILNMSH